MYQAHSVCRPPKANGLVNRSARAVVSAAGRTAHGVCLIHYTPPTDHNHQHDVHRSPRPSDLRPFAARPQTCAATQPPVGPFRPATPQDGLLAIAGHAPAGHPVEEPRDVRGRDRHRADARLQCGQDLRRGQRRQPGIPPGPGFLARGNAVVRQLRFLDRRGPRQGPGRRPAEDPAGNSRPPPQGRRYDRGNCFHGAEGGRRCRGRRGRSDSQRRRDHRRRGLDRRIGHHRRIGRP